MKRIAYFLLVTIFMMCWMAFPGSAAERKQEIIQFEDGSYAIVEVTTTGARAAKSVNGSKQYTYCDSDGVAQWKAVLNGSFTYTGSTATCTSSSCSITIYISDWYTISKNASKSGNVASCSVTMGKKVLGVVVDKMSANLSLKCDANGNLS